MNLLFGGKALHLAKRYEEIKNLLDSAFPRRFVLQQGKEDMIELLTEKLIKNRSVINLDFGEVSPESPAIILSLRESEEIYDIKESTTGFEREKEEIIFKIKLEDQISPDEIVEEDSNAESRYNSGN